MSTLSDRVLLTLSEPDGLADLLAPGGAPPPARLNTIVAAVYDLQGTRIHRIDRVTVRDVLVQRPLFPVAHHTGTWTGTTPAYSRTDIAIDRTAIAAPQWVDLLLMVVLRVVVEIDPVGVESVSVKEIEGFTTLEEFRARFRFIDLDDFMARHKLSTVEDLRDAYRYLLTEVRLRTPPVFDPADPANHRDIKVTLAVLVREQLDVTAALRDAQLVRALAADVVCTPPGDGGIGPVTAPYALAVVFAQAPPGPPGPTADAVHTLFAREGVLSLFFEPA